MEFKHISVLKEESISGLNIKADGVYVDCTLGGGGHSLEIASRLTTGRLICFDCGHYIHHFKSDEMSKEIIEFINSKF